MEEISIKDKLCTQGLSSILAYYRERVDTIQKERDEWFERLESLRISQEDYHKQEWELKKRNEEIAELQKSLSDSHVALLEERELTLRLRRDNEELQGRAVEDRRKIMELLALNGSVEQDITYVKDCRPGIFVFRNTVFRQGTEASADDGSRKSECREEVSDENGFGKEND